MNTAVTAQAGLGFKVYGYTAGGVVSFRTIYLGTLGLLLHCSFNRIQTSYIRRTHYSVPSRLAVTSYWDPPSLH